MKKQFPKIDMSYTARVFYDVFADARDGGEAQQKVESRAFVLAARQAGVEVATFDGLGRIGPHVEFVATTETKARRCAEKLQRYIARFKDLSLSSPDA